jgi:MYXO-CTERM domain-containing protein
MVAAMALAVALTPGFAAAKDTWTTPYPGVRHLFRTTATPWRIFVLEVDLCSAGVSMRATKTGERGRTTSSFGQVVAAQAAINGDLFSAGSNYKTSGLAAGGGGVWVDTKDNSSEGFVAFGPGRAALSPAKAVVDPAEAWMDEVVSGRPQVVKDGVVLASDPADVACNVRNPRTSAGLSRDGRTLYLAVVDGRTDISDGMKCTELGALMAGLGAWNALNYDGGGSSTMWLAKSGVVNDPSDGVQRVVSNHLGIWADGLGDPGSCDRSLEESALAGDIYAASTTTDIDGDGRADVCARAAKGIVCALASADGFAPSLVGPELSDASGWADRTNYATIRMGDLDGDGRADLCARGDGGMRCWLSLGDGFGPAFDGPEWSDATGWGAPEYHGTIRLADFDGDGRDDLCARAASGFRCHSSTGAGFGPAVSLAELADSAGFAAPDQYGTIRMADIDGDGRADVCARGAKGLRCWPSLGDSFGVAVVGPAWTDANGWDQLQYWSTIRMADVDGDGRADACARSSMGFACHLSDGAGFGPAIAGPSWRDDNGWSDYDNYSTIRMGDLDGDGRNDVCGRANAKIVCARFDGVGFGPGFDGPLLADGAGWDVHERYATLRLADVDGDRRADLCVRGAAGVECHLSDGAGFSKTIAGPTWSDQSGWKQVEYYSTMHAAGPACAAVERCNGRDDDCDDMIDEGCDPETTSGTSDDTGADPDDTTSTDGTGTDTTGTTGTTGSETEDMVPTTAGVDPIPGSSTWSPDSSGEDTADPSGCDCSTPARPDGLLMLALLALLRRRHISRRRERLE